MNRECCINRFNYDKRTPGLFKLAYNGDGCIALGSKSYMCFSNTKHGIGNVKAATKGISKTLNSLTKQEFIDVLKTKKK